MTIESNCELKFWHIREDDKRCLGGRLQAAGWLGMTFCHVSFFERHVLNKFAKKHHESVKLMRPTYFDSDSFRLCEHSMWFKTFDLRTELVALVDQIPKRSLMFQLDDAVDVRATTMRHRTLFNSVNWSAVSSDFDGDFLSIADTAEAAMVRMLLA